MEIHTISFIIFIISVVAEPTVLDDSIYKADSVVYTAKDDIVDIHCSESNEDIILIVERNLTSGLYKGLYALKSDDKDTFISSKILDNGQCTTSDNQTIFFGASDGIYTYNFKTKQAEKYGNVSVNVKAIQKHANKDIIYIIADNRLNKITENGTKLQIVESVNNVHEIVLDEDDNVYFYEKHDANGKFEDIYSKPKVIIGDKIVNVKDLPDKYNQIKLARTLASSQGALLILDKRIYRIFANGSSFASDYIFKKEPTAYFFDIGIIQLFGHDQKLYQFNIIELILQGLSSHIGTFFNSFFNN